MKCRVLVVVALYLLLLGEVCGAATKTDLFDAVRAGDAEKTKGLLQSDPKLAGARTEDGSTALHLAALEGQAEVVRLLLAAGAQVNARGLREETPLHMVMYDGHREVAELLLASHADVNVQNAAGETPLHLAARKGYRELVELLLSQNADPGARDLAGRTPKAAATEKQHWEVAALLTPLVGEFYDLQRFVFEGARTFPPEALREALQNTRDFFEVSHPLAPQEAYLEEIQQKLVLGYQHHGFADARLETRRDAKAGRIVVKVEEGPRYVCGAVKVSGAQKVPAVAIIERLTRPRTRSQAAKPAFDFKDKAPATNPLTQALSNEPDPRETPWVKGDPAPFSNIDLQLLRARVTDLLREQGFLFPKLNVSIMPDKAARTAELQVEVLDEGPRSVIERIDIVGNRTNTARAVLRYLDLKPGMELTSQLLASVEDRLWRAARFLSYKVTPGSPDDTGRVPLQIEVVEYSEAPTLAQTFSQIEQAMLKLREWVSKLDQSGEDMVVNISGFPGPVPAGEVILSPRSGLALQMKDMTPTGDGRVESALVLKAGHAGFYSRAGGRKLLLACPRLQLTTLFAVDARSPDTNQSPFNLSIGAGFNSLQDDAASAPAYRFELTLLPVACIGLAHRWDCASWFDGDVLIRSNATMLLKLNASNGRIIEFSEAGESGDETIHIRFEPGAFERAVQRIETSGVGLPDVVDTNAPFSSAVSFLAEELWSSRFLASLLHTNLSATTLARLPALLRQFKLGDILEPWNQFVAQTNAPAGMPEAFSIPEDRKSGDVTAGDAVAVVSGWFLRHSDELFAARSWPWTLVREASFTFQGKSRYTQQALAGIYESGDTGPLGYLAIAELLGRMQPPLARRFAARGLDRLSATGFLRDVNIFLSGNSVVSRCLLRLATSLRDMDPEQLAALAKLQSAARGEFLQECSRRLRAAKDQPVIEALAPALEFYWEGELKEQVATALKAQAFDPDEAFKQGLAAYQGASQDHSQAARLFAQAASQGHAGAQYYLAMIYERGVGVPRDLPTALNWYRQSATNGFAEAAVVLGNYYSDGLELKRDHVEAFVWYSVAAAQGHRLAEAFRNGARRNLTAEQLAAAAKRVTTIVASRPNADATHAPSSGSDL